MKVYCEDCKHCFLQGQYDLNLCHIDDTKKYKNNVYYCLNDKTSKKKIIPADPIFKEKFHNIYKECGIINKNNDCPDGESRYDMSYCVVSETIKEKWYKKLFKIFCK